MRAQPNTIKDQEPEYNEKNRNHDRYNMSGPLDCGRMVRFEGELCIAEQGAVHKPWFALHRSTAADMLDMVPVFSFLRHGSNE